MVTPKGQCRDPNVFEASYISNRYCGSPIDETHRLYNNLWLAHMLWFYLSLIFLHFVGEVTFLEFVQYVIHDKKSDIHWMPQYRHCNPCLIKYDFIGRYESLQEDVKHVLAKITEQQSNITLPALHGKNVRVSLKDIYAKLPRYVMQRLISKYKTDYDLFGYDYQWACSDC